MTYQPALDGLRAFAVFGVVGFHCGVPMASGGYIGVDVFFVLSGFLITGLLLGQHENGGIQLVRFWLRRALRLVPALLVLLIVYLAVAPYLWPSGGHGVDSILVALYISDYSHAFFGRPDVLRHTWSLSVEEHFYLLWPLLLMALLPRLDPRSLARACLLLFVLATLWRLFRYSPDTTRLVYYSFDTRTTGLLLGAALAAYVTCIPVARWKHQIRPAAGLLAVLVGLCVALQWRDPRFFLLGMTVIEATTALLIASLLGSAGWTAWILSSAPLAYLGRISYGIYLWHYPAALYVRDMTSWPTTLAISTAFGVGCAALSYHTVEAWARRYRDRLARPGTCQTAPRPQNT